MGASLTTILISGATGFAGRFIAEGFLKDGHDVIAMGRAWPPPGFFSEPVEWVAGDLDPDHDFAPAFSGVDVFIHCAFQHVPGRYRGGEADDPDGFVRANVDGTLALMQAAQTAGVCRTIFLSSRAVYGPQPPGTTLTEQTPCAPDTLYGEVKLAVEQALADIASDRFLPVILRATGIYGPGGPGRTHKWSDLCTAFKAGEPIASRIGTEVHGDDLANAVCLLATCPTAVLSRFGPPPIFNVSDILLDRHDLLAAYAAKAAITHAPPHRADAAAFNVMDCSRLKALGWRPRGSLDLTGVSSEP